MKNIMKNLLLVLLTGLLVTVAVGCGKGGGQGSDAQKVKYPTKQITLIVPFAAGGSSDMCARSIADQMQKILGQPMVVVNKTGAGGGIGAAEAVRAKPDGYTLFNASNGPATIVPYTSDVGYTYKDFKPVAQLTEMPFVLSVQKDSPLSTLEEFIKYAKEHPGQIRVGSPGAGSIQHVTLERFAKDVGIKLQHMPYEGSNPAVAALLGGHIEATLTGTPEVTGHYKSGALKVLGVTSGERIKFLPDVPTFKEQGYNLLAGAWYGILAPKDTPDEIVKKLADAMKQASDSNEVRQAWEKLYLLPAFKGPEEYGARIEQESQSNQSILKNLGLAK